MNGTVEERFCEKCGGPGVRAKRRFCSLACAHSMKLRERFDEKWMPAPPSECWLWTGASPGGRYGAIDVNGRLVLAHRVSWELHNGPIPAGLLVCHHCDVR